MVGASVTMACILTYPRRDSRPANHGGILGQDMLRLRTTTPSWFTHNAHNIGVPKRMNKFSSGSPTVLSIWRLLPTHKHIYMYIRSYHLTISYSYTYIYTGRCFGTFFLFPYIGNVIIPTDELIIIFFRGVALPPTSNG